MDYDERVLGKAFEMKYFTVKGIFLLLALCLLLIGCQAGDQLDTAVPDCGETEGRLVRERLEETERV